MMGMSDLLGLEISEGALTNIFRPSVPAFAGCFRLES